MWKARTEDREMKSIDDFIKAYEAAQYWWEPLDRPILAAFSAYPGHDDVGEVFAKIALVNRVYRANLQMGGKDSEWKVAERMVEQREKLNTMFVRLRSCERFCRDTLPCIMDAHEQLLPLAGSVTGRVENSFCSKYLSFHLPDSIPIFDRWAYRSSWKLMKKRLPRGMYSGKSNIDYGYHCEAVICLIDALKSHLGHFPSLKLVDYILYSER